jgi:hypothetical protein
MTFDLSARELSFGLLRNSGARNVMPKISNPRAYEQAAAGLNPKYLRVNANQISDN